MEKEINNIKQNVERSENILLAAKNFSNEINKGSAEDFIEWHNSQATSSNRLSESWVRGYFKSLQK